ncbi:MAG: hypothetical protein ACD_50C00049G0001 [uncultured bacterium]|nr:MAG: hypothetical protein ACD_50C00049G0001 [uncultured bacterium]OGH13321.1 MAG: transaldolase [Candidatus Levybacteria bacterium RIFCSPHIGHO2_01_FULL_38_26]
MKPRNLKTKIFLDSGDPEETKEVIKLLRFLDGQTTNPTLISKNPAAKVRLDKGDKFTKEEILGFYKEVVKEISNLIPQGSISIEVYSDKNTNSEEMLEQGREMFSWIPGAHIKFPATKEGLKAANQAVKEGMRVNMTLCFSQEQAAAVYTATNNSKQKSLKGFKNVFVSPFIGRLDDKGENGMDLIENIIRMYQKGDGHVEVLTASVRTLDHFLYAIKLGSNIITSPFKIIKEWAEKGMPMPDESFEYKASGLKPIPYQEIDLNKPWQEYNVKHELTDIGIEKFSEDWNKLIK